MRTDEPRYTERLSQLEAVWWKRWLDVQRPYRWHLRGLKLGFVLDVGCGTGRNLINLGGRGAGIGIDHNPASVAAAREKGLEAFLPDDFRASRHAAGKPFDSLLLSHVIEHMSRDEAKALLARYLPHLKPAGRVVLITPQEAGFRSDDTHVAFTDLDALAEIARATGLGVVKRYSFPFPRPFGRVFKHNEFVLLARVPPA